MRTCVRVRTSDMVDVKGAYTIKETHPDGSLVIVPLDTPDATPAHGGARDATHEEFAAFVAAYGPFLAPDGEG
jgi:hypothetical protein